MDVRGPQQRCVRVLGAEPRHRTVQSPGRLADIRRALRRKHGVDLMGDRCRAVVDNRPERCDHVPEAGDLERGRQVHRLVEDRTPPVEVSQADRYASCPSGNQCPAISATVSGQSYRYSALLAGSVRCWPPWQLRCAQAWSASCLCAITHFTLTAEWSSPRIGQRSGWLLRS